MTAVWLAVALVGVATVALKGAGPLVFADRPLPRTFALVMPLLAPCLLAALVVGQTVADGRAVVVDARLAGVAAAGGRFGLAGAALGRSCQRGRRGGGGAGVGRRVGERQLRHYGGDA